MTREGASGSRRVGDVSLRHEISAFSLGLVVVHPDLVRCAAIRPFSLLSPQVAPIAQAATHEDERHSQTEIEPDFVLADCE